MTGGEDKLAINGGTPVRAKLLPYGRQCIDDVDIAAVTEALKQDFITTGPLVTGFENAIAEKVGAKHCVAVCNGTAALHAAAYVAGVREGDEVIVPTMTFCASANCVRYCGGTVKFADILPDTLQIDPKSVEKLITPRTKAIVVVDYTGQPVDLDAIMDIANRHNLLVIEDASHAIGAEYKGRKVGSIAHFTTFSFHPVKHITTGEGGAICTNDDAFDKKLRAFRGHGIETDMAQRAAKGTFHYDMVFLGFNYRLTDIQCALGISQIKKLDRWVERRNDIARRYDAAFKVGDLADAIKPVIVAEGCKSAYHLYVVQFNLSKMKTTRQMLYAAMRGEGMGVNVHYMPVHLHPYYKQLGNTPNQCPVAEAAYEQMLTLPLYPEMSDNDVDDVVRAVTKMVDAFYSK